MRQWRKEGNGGSVRREVVRGEEAVAGDASVEGIDAVDEERQWEQWRW